MNLWLIWIAVTVAGIAAYEWLQHLRHRRRERAKVWVAEFCVQFPGKCPVCSFARWGREMGIPAAYDPVEPHPCVEAIE